MNPFAERLQQVPDSELRPIADATGETWRYIVKVRKGEATPYGSRAARLATALGEDPIEWRLISQNLGHFPVWTTPVQMGKRMAWDIRHAGLTNDQLCAATGWKPAVLDAFLNGDSVMGLTQIQDFVTLVRGDIHWYNECIASGREPVDAKEQEDGSDVLHRGFIDRGP